MEAVLFFIAAIGALGGAIGVVSSRNPFYSVLALIAHLFALAVLFLLLTSAFVAAAQVVVYAGAVMVLYVFVTAYVGGSQEPAWEPIPGQQFLAPLLGSALFVELSIAATQGKIEGGSLRLYGSQSGQWSLNYANLRNGLLTSPVYGGFDAGDADEIVDDAFAVLGYGTDAIHIFAGDPGPGEIAFGLEV